MLEDCLRVTTHLHAPLTANPTFGKWMTRVGWVLQHLTSDMQWAQASQKLLEAFSRWYRDTGNRPSTTHLQHGERFNQKNLNGRYCIQWNSRQGDGHIPIYPYPYEWTCKHSAFLKWSRVRNFVFKMRLVLIFQRFLILRYINIWVQQHLVVYIFWKANKWYLLCFPVRKPISFNQPTFPNWGAQRPAPKKTTAMAMSSWGKQRKSHLFQQRNYLTFTFCQNSCCCTSNTTFTFNLSSWMVCCLSMNIIMNRFIASLLWPVFFPLGKKVPVPNASKAKTF